MTSLPIFEGLLPLDKKRFPTELVAGATLAALAIPEVMGYTSIAGMPVITGLYTLVLPVLVFAVLGSSRHLVVGADSATAAVMAAGLAGMAAIASPQYVALAGLMALMAGALLLIARLVGLGFLADFLSRSVLVGFLTGVGIQVAMGQVGGVFGVPEATGITVFGMDWTGTVGKFLGTLQNLGDVNWPTVAVSAGVLVVIVGAKKLNPSIPGALIAVIGAIAVSWWWDLAADGVAILGPVPSGLPKLAFPDVTWSDVGALSATAVSIFVVVLAQSAATSRAYAAKYNDSFSEDTDLVGLAGASVGAGLTGTFVVNGSPTKTQMVDGAGGRSQLAQLTTAALVILVLLFLTVPLQYMPKAVLASVVLLIGIELVDVKGMNSIRKLRLDEFVVASLTAFVVVTVGVKQGILLAIVLSVLDHMRKSYRPATAILEAGAAEGEWHAAEVGPDVRTIPGLAVYRFAGSLYYANANKFLEDMTALASSADPPKWVCLDLNAMPDIDYTGSQTIKQVVDELHEHHVRLVAADPMPAVAELITRYQLHSLMGDGSVFDTVEEAVDAFRASVDAPG